MKYSQRTIIMLPRFRGEASKLIKRGWGRYMWREFVALDGLAKNPFRIESGQDHLGRAKERVTRAIGPLRHGLIGARTSATEVRSSAHRIGCGSIIVPKPQIGDIGTL